MITFKGPAEFARMRRAGRVVAEVLAKVREAARPGVELSSLDRLAASIVAERGCLPSFLNYHGYPAHICLSPNETIVHGIPDGRRLREGDILSVDMGAISEGWHGDAAVTFGIGEISPEARRLLEATEKALWAGIEQCRDGQRLGDVADGFDENDAERPDEQPHDQALLDVSDRQRRPEHAHLFRRRSQRQHQGEQSERQGEQVGANIACDLDHLRALQP